jgi:hypothetical protein
MISCLVQVAIDGERYILLEVETDRWQDRILGRKDNQQVSRARLHAVPALRDEHRKQFPRQRPLEQLPQALVGLGGIGKTQIALEYIYRYMHDYHTIVWLRADTLQTLRSDYAAMATLLNLPEKQQPDQEQIISAVKHWLRG